MTSLGSTTVTLLLCGAAAMAAAPPRTVSIKTFKFRPDTLVVQVGDSVNWTNEDEIEHTVTSDSATRRGLSLDGVLKVKGASYRTSFTSPGTYPYHCDRHQFMRGVVRVTSPGEQP
jgi:plastocyanin